MQVLHGAKNLSILKHPVNPVIYMDVVYVGFAWSKNLPLFSLFFIHPVQLTHARRSLVAGKVVYQLRPILHYEWQGR